MIRLVAQCVHAFPEGWTCSKTCLVKIGGLPPNAPRIRVQSTRLGQMFCILLRVRMLLQPDVPMIRDSIALG